MKYQLTLLAEDTPGVLSHIVSLISRRSFNINTLSVGYTEEEHVTRMRIMMIVEHTLPLSNHAKHMVIEYYYFYI